MHYRATEMAKALCRHVGVDPDGFTGFEWQGGKAAPGTANWTAFLDAVDVVDKASSPWEVKDPTESRMQRMKAIMDYRASLMNAGIVPAKEVRRPGSKIKYLSDGGMIVTAPKNLDEPQYRIKRGGLVDVRWSARVDRVKRWFASWFGTGA